MTDTPQELARKLREAYPRSAYSHASHASDAQRLVIDAADALVAQAGELDRYREALATTFDLVELRREEDAWLT